MAKKIKGFYKLFLSFLMALVGFSACSKHEKEIRYEYGSPYSNLKVVGKVVDKNNTPVDGVKIQIKPNDPNWHEWYVIGERMTDSKGNFVFEESVGGSFSSIRYVFVKKGNTAKSEGFKDDSVSVAVKKIKDGKSWCQGDFEATGTLKLKDN